MDDSTEEVAFAELRMFRRLIVRRFAALGAIGVLVVLAAGIPVSPAAAIPALLLVGVPAAAWIAERRAGRRRRQRLRRKS